MVIYNGVHYDALALAPGPKAQQEQDITELNPRSRRGQAIIAAAQKLVRRPAAPLSQPACCLLPKAKGCLGGA
jgi:hypothetical protein